MAPSHGGAEPWEQSAQRQQQQQKGDRSCWPVQRRQHATSVPSGDAAADVDSAELGVRGRPTTSLGVFHDPELDRRLLDPDDVARALTGTLGPWLHSSLLEVFQKAGLLPPAGGRASSSSEGAPPAGGGAPALEDIKRCMEAVVKEAVAARKEAEAPAPMTEADTARSRADSGPGSAEETPKPSARLRPALKSSVAATEAASEEQHQPKHPDAIRVMVKSASDIGEEFGVESGKEDALSRKMSVEGDTELPTLMTNKMAFEHKKSIAFSEWSQTTKGNQTHEDANKKAFVVNFRRLLVVKDFLQGLHEVIKAATVALLALLAVRNELGLVYNIVFISFGIALFTLHQLVYNIVDIHDFKFLAGQLGNDGEALMHDCPWLGGVVGGNPNRHIRAVSYSKRPWNNLAPGFFLACLVVLCSLTWWVVGRWWTIKDDLWDELGLQHHGKAEMENYITLLLVGTFMLLCHIVFQVVYWRETRFIMPSRKDGQPWDVGEHGLPPGLLTRIFGLPCVWFSTRAAYEDLRIWVTLANPSARRTRKFLNRRRDPSARMTIEERVQTAFYQVSTEEFAMYALVDKRNASQLRKCLLQAKLFDKLSNKFLCRNTWADFNTRHRDVVGVKGLSRLHSRAGHEEFWAVNVLDGDEDKRPEPLGIELLFFDSRSGEVWTPYCPEEDDQDLGEVLPRKERNFVAEMLDGPPAA